MTDDMALAGRVGSGFVSRDNDDPTAAAIFTFMAKAAIGRQHSILWNTVPWWNGTRSIKKEELVAGKERLDELLKLLPKLAVVVGVGSKAQSAENSIAARGVPFIRSAHPSPINRASRPALWASIPDQWSEAKKYAPI
ncbi:uracil-DNA glycosylase [Mameliella sediminis]|uniref:uracil-DNA glycosylase n=1 Tax=Mameliella sediminis TaxID=2836866 RepID=UPI001FE78615|nr:uracil-DNA glycosylase [Mameliella sediminis]